MAADEKNEGAVVKKQTESVALTAGQLLAKHLELEPGKMIDIIKANCFKVSASSVTNEMLGAFINVARSLTQRAPSFNPLLPGMLYAYPTKGGGIEPMIGPDGMFALLGAFPGITHWETEVEERGGKLFAVKATIYRRDQPPISKRVLLSEWYMDSNPNWKSRPTHMLEIRAIKQCARQIIHGMPLDKEEREIIDVQATRIDDPIPADLPPQSKDAGRKATEKKRLEAAKAADPTPAPSESEKPGVEPANESGGLFGDEPEPDEPHTKGAYSQ